MSLSSNEQNLSWERRKKKKCVAIHFRHVLLSPIIIFMHCAKKQSFKTFPTYSTNSVFFAGYTLATTNWNFTHHKQCNCCFAPSRPSQKKKYKSYHWGGNFLRSFGNFLRSFRPKGCILVTQRYILVPFQMVLS